MYRLLLIIGIVLQLPAISCGPSQAERDSANRALERQQAVVQRELDRQLLATQTRHVELTLGEAVAATFNLCHTYPPTTAEHQRKCKALDDKLARIEAEEDKHPW